MASSPSPSNYHRHDVVVVGAGGAGLMAAIQLAGLADVAVISKLYPSRSHTGAAHPGADRGDRGRDAGRGDGQVPLRLPQGLFKVRHRIMLPGAARAFPRHRRPREVRGTARTAWLKATCHAGRH